MSLTASPEQAIKDQAASLGFDDCRITSARPPETAEQLTHWLNQGMQAGMEWMGRNAEKRRDPGQVLTGARSVITLAVGYGPAPSHSAPSETGTGTVARYARYEDYHEVLASGLKSLSGYVESRFSGTCLWYVDTGPILERDLAQRAGLGFVGKHTNLIHPGLGNWFFLAEILTTVPLVPDPPARNRCGTCVRCLDACPTRAIVAPFQLDARLCISYWTIEHKGSIPEPLRPLIGHRVFGCDDCLAVCPWNRFAREGTLMKPHFKPELNPVDLVEWLALSPAEFKQRFQGTPLFRTRRRRLLRNACVALGNVGDGTALPALRRAAAAEDPLIAEHALWAMDRIGSRHGV